MSKRKTTKIVLGSGSIGIGSRPIFPGAELFLDELTEPANIGTKCRELIDPTGLQVVIEIRSLAALEVLERHVNSLRTHFMVSAGCIG